MSDHYAPIEWPRPDEKIECPAGPPSAAPVVLLILGQSNAANYGETRGRSTSGALWFDGRCYGVADPLAGGSGRGGSIWSRLPTLARERSSKRELVLVVHAADATRIADWIARDAISRRLAEVVTAIRAHNLAISAVLWQQGEADAQAGTDADSYAAGLTTLVQGLRDQGIAAPVLLARSTRCRSGGSDAVRGAMARVAQGDAGVLLGPDTDSLGDAFRFDGCHFNDNGLQRAASLWLDALRAANVIDSN